MIGTKAVYREHERSTLAQLTGELGTRESGHAEGYKVTQTNNGTFLHTPSMANNGTLVDSHIMFSDDSGRIGQSTGLTFGTATSTLTTGTISADSATFASAVILTSIVSGATQVASGAIAGQLWKTASHASLPDNVVLVGV